MTVFSATFATASITSAGGIQDIFELVAPANSRVVIHDVVLAQFSDELAAEAEIVSILLMRGHSSSGSGGVDITTTGVANLNPYGRATGCTVERNNSTLASGGSPETLWADGWHLQAGFIWRMSERLNMLGNDGKIVLKPSQRFVVRMNEAIADDISANGTLLFEEIGKVPA